MNDFGGIRVLVVEPDPWTRTLLLDLFRSEGAVVDGALNLADAVGCAEVLRPQLLVTNYLLNDGLTGQDLALSLRAKNPLLGLIFLSKLPEADLSLVPRGAELLDGAKYHSAGEGFSVDRLLALVASVLPGVPSK